MELFELVLLLLVCVMISSVLDQIISKISLPLLQIAVGLAAAIVMPHLADVHVDSELFMLVFIAPMLFREAKETDRIMLWKTKWSVLSMAIALVVVSVLAAGFILNWIVPSIPLAAAFACAAALGPTDAAAVSALGPTIQLTKRQSMLLSGESLINDASGVVSFQFAIAAAMTGAFSAAEAAGSFAVLFFGGIAAGIIAGFLLKRGMLFLKRKGYVSTTIHVMYEVITPFALFILAEEIHVSGILAVVAAGLVMQEHRMHMPTPEEARHEMVSGSFWEVIIFLINGVIFVMLGMQLPKVMDRENMGGISPAVVIGTMLAVTAVIITVRFIWLACMGMRYKDPETGARGIKTPGHTLKEALVTTIAGPKGAVTLSIILTIPLFTEGGYPFPQRDLIIFITSGVILCTLLLADFVLPKLAPKEKDEAFDKQMHEGRIAVLEGVISELRKVLDEHADSDFAPAVRLSMMRYRIRLMRERFEEGENKEIMVEMVNEVLKVQQARADEIQKDLYGRPVAERMPYYSILPAIRASIGYFGGAAMVGAKFEKKKGRMLLRLARLKRKDYDDEKSARIYYDTCLFAIDLEHAAIDYLKETKAKCDAQRAEAVDILLNEHETALESLWGRINYNQENPRDEAMDLQHGIHDTMPEGMRANTQEQFNKAREYAEEADANVLAMELDQIRRLRAAGKISAEVSKELRDQVYLLQTAQLEV